MVSPGSMEGGCGYGRGALAAVVVVACSLCIASPRGHCAVPGPPADAKPGGQVRVPGLPPGVGLGMSVDDLRAARPKAQRWSGPVLVKGGQPGTSTPVVAYSEDLQDFLGCWRGSCLYTFEADRCTVIWVKLSYLQSVLREKRSSLIKAWVKRFGSGFRRTTGETRSRGVALVGPQLVWRTDWGCATLLATPDLEGVEPDEGEVTLKITSREEMSGLRPYFPEKHGALFGCVEEALREVGMSAQETEAVTPRPGTSVEALAHSTSGGSRGVVIIASAALATAIGLAALLMLAFAIYCERRHVVTGRACGDSSMEVSPPPSVLTTRTHRLVWLLLCVLSLAAATPLVLWVLGGDASTSQAPAAGTRNAGAGSGGQEGLRPASSSSIRPGPATQAGDKMVIGVGIEGEGASEKLRIELDEVPVADLDGLRVRLADLAKKPGATERPVVVAVLKGTPFRWVREVLGVLSECGYQTIRFTEVDF